MPASAGTLRLVTVQMGDRWYEPLIGQVRSDATLRERMRAEADHHLVEGPGRLWTVAAAQLDGRWTPVAWCCTFPGRVAGEAVIRCTEGYERPGVGRAVGAYASVYAHRHAVLIAATPLPAVTYLHADPPGLTAMHLADGWVEVAAGVSGGHAWRQLRREPRPRLAG